MAKSAILALEDGSIFHGVAIGAAGSTVGELVFNTSITGYQEILSDPSYAKQIITFTHPHIGNVGTNAEDAEATSVFSAGVVIRDLPNLYHNHRAQLSLNQWLVDNNLCGIAEVDTRALTNLLREKGALAACIVTDNSTSTEEAIAQAQNFPGLKGCDLAKEVTTQSHYHWQEPSWQKAPPKQLKHKVVVLDFGVKRNILRLLVDVGCDLTVLPATATTAEIMSHHPDGIFLSNGPGDPAACDYAINTVKELLSLNLPMFGICLGHQILALACGAQTQKMKFGHHGANHPVQNCATGEVVITSQNHGFAVSKEQFPQELVVTHVSLFDHSIQGVAHRNKPVLGFQGHPEASPGPHDLIGLFSKFTQLITKQEPLDEYLMMETVSHA